MEKKRSKIVKIEFKREWTGKFGKMYEFLIYLQNGEWGHVNFKTIEGEYKENDEISYELEQRNSKWYLNIDKPQNKGFGGGGESPEKQRSIARQCAVKEACGLVVGGKIELNQLFIMSDKIFEWINKK